MRNCFGHEKYSSGAPFGTKNTALRGLFGSREHSHAALVRVRLAEQMRLIQTCGRQGLFNVSSHSRAGLEHLLDVRHPPAPCPALYYPSSYSLSSSSTECDAKNSALSILAGLGGLVAGAAFWLLQKAKRNLPK